MRPGMQNAKLLTEEIDLEDNTDRLKEKTSQDYKDLNEKCEAVLVKISKRKKTIKSK